MRCRSIDALTVKSFPHPLLLQKKLQQRQPQAKRDFCHCLFINLVIDQKSKEGIASVKAHKNKQAHNNKCMQQYDGNGEIEQKKIGNKSQCILSLLRSFLVVFVPCHMHAGM